MPTPDAKQKRVDFSSPQVENQSRWGRWRLTTVLPFISLMVVVALAVAPLREALSWASRSRPEPDQIRAELNTALEQIYRSFELEDEAATYDQIAQSVTGDAIREIYLEVRRSLSDQDGGRVSIDHVRVSDIDRIEWQSDGGCRMDATWAVRGTLGHFGHEHERQNRYRARIKLLPQADAWKLSSIQITEQEREW